MPKWLGSTDLQCLNVNKGPDANDISLLLVKIPVPVDGDDMDEVAMVAEAEVDVETVKDAADEVTGLSSMVWMFLIPLELSLAKSSPTLEKMAGDLLTNAGTT